METLMPVKSRDAAVTNVRALLRILKMSNQELAVALDVDPQRISDFFAGRWGSRWDLLDRLCQAFNERIGEEVIEPKHLVDPDFEIPAKIFERPA